jgi:hypothetical protein
MVASGLGSTLSLRLVAGSDRRLRRVLGGVVAAVAFGASPLVNAAAGWPLAAKVILTAAMVAPAAFLMGIPFSSGLRRLEQMHAPSVRWAWSVNAAASVLGSAGAMFIAIYCGLRTTMLCGALLYVCALAAIVATSRPRTPAA